YISPCSSAPPPTPTLPPFPYTTLFRSKRRTRAQIAREAGIEPLADALLANPAVDPEQIATEYVGTESPYDNVKGVLDGARDILRSEEHTSELQSRFDLVCRLLLDKKIA